jgi:hypothetical protein
MKADAVSIKSPDLFRWLGRPGNPISEVPIPDARRGAYGDKTRGCLPARFLARYYACPTRSRPQGIGWQAQCLCQPVEQMDPSSCCTVCAA